MNTAVIGAARVVFGADTTEFDSKAKGVEGVLGRLVDKFQEVERRLKALGVGVTLGITVPFAAMTRAVDKGAGDFEAQMNRVRAALQSASPRQIEQLADAARTLGPAVNKGAAEAAGAIDDLARAGVSASDILGGALKVTLQLAAAGMTDASSAASLVTDIMGQFGKSAADLPLVMTNVIGALDASKMNFDDFRLAVGQGGAVAASSGVSFEEFAATISSVSTQFTSGADAGTSFKTYMQSLVGKSKEAKSVMDQLGISFFDAQGHMKPMADQAEILRTALGNLTDDSRNEALNTIFGADAARIAIGLMNQGREGFEKYRAAVANGDVDAKIAIMAQGSEAAGQRIAVAWESVKISLGETGLLEITTSIKNAFAGMLESIANAPPLVLQIAAAFAGLVAVLGPALIVLGHLAAFLLPLIAARFGILGLAISALINPVGTMTVLIARLISTFAAGAIIARMGAMLAALLTPIGLVVAAVTALTFLWQMHEAQIAASEAEQARLRDTMVGTKPALDKVAQAVAELSGKTGDAAKQARDHANAMLGEARAAVVAAQAIAQKRVQVANAEKASAERYAANARGTTFGASGAAAAGVVQVGTNALRERAQLARAEAQAAIDGLKEAQGQLGKLNDAINSPKQAPQHIDFSASTPASKPTRAAGEQGANYDMQNRQQMRDELELEAARLRGDVEAERIIRNRLDLNRQIEAYQRTGLALTAATGAAQADMATLEAARQVGLEKDLQREEAAHQIELARVTGNRSLEESLQRQQDLKDRINSLVRSEVPLARAIAIATREQLENDEARAKVRARLLTDGEQDRQLRLAQERGDTDERIRQLQREIDIRDRARELEGSFTPDVARQKAENESDEMERARQTGVFRETFRDGVRAALDGDLRGWVKNWWKDRVAKGMEEALNSLADLIQSLFSRLGRAGDSGGGLLGAITGAVGGILGGGASLSGNSAASSAAQGIDWNDLPKFKTGGSFKVGGRSGIDQNLVAFRATANEVVDIHTPGNDNGPAGVSVYQTIAYSGAVDIADRAYVERMAMATKQATMQAMDERGRRR